MFQALIIRKNINGTWQDEKSQFGNLPTMENKENSNDLFIQVLNDGYFYKVDLLYVLVYVERFQ